MKPSSAYTDPYKIYKSIRQRANRALWDDDKQEMAEIARRIVLAIYRSRPEIRPGTEIFAQIEDDLSILQRLEQNMAINVSLASRLRRVIKEGDFPLEIPYQILPLWQDHTSTNGYIYILTSPNLPGYTKIGATTINVSKRASLFAARYRIPVNIAYHQTSYDPFKVEKKISRVFSELRVRVNSLGHSNEWYLIAPEHVIDKIKEYRIQTPLAASEIDPEPSA